MENASSQRLWDKAGNTLRKLRSASSPVAIDTITTRFLLLFLFLLAIPLTTVIIFTLSLLATYIDQDGNKQLTLSKNLFEAAIAQKAEKLELMETVQRRKPLINQQDYCRQIQAEICIIADYKHELALLGSEQHAIPLETLYQTSPDLPRASQGPISEPPFFARIQNKLYLLNKSDHPPSAHSDAFWGIAIDETLLNQIYRQQPSLQTQIWLLQESELLDQPDVIANQASRITQQVSTKEFLSELSHIPPHTEQPITVKFDKNQYRILPTNLYGKNQQKIGQVIHMLPLAQNQMLLGNYYLGIYIISVASLLFSVLLAMMAGRTITQPLLKLITQVNTLSRNNVTKYESDVVVTGVHEIKQLGEAFNRMIKRLRQEHKMKDEFVATLTHDLKVPLLAEKQTLSYFLKHSYGPLTAEQAEVLEILQSSNRSCLDLVNGLLEVYRYDSGEVSLLFEAFNLSKLLEETKDELQSLAMEKSLALQIFSDFDSHTDESVVFADRLEIKRVLHNLISNAIINTPHQGTIKCRVTNAEHYGSDTIYKVSSFQYTTLKYPLKLTDRILVIIQDSGIGFSNNDLSSLFKQFAASKGRNPMSIGLGLYNCHQVLTAHNGVLWVESTEGEGSMVGFLLPQNKQAAQDRRLFRDRRQHY